MPKKTPWLIIGIGVVLLVIIVIAISIFFLKTSIITPNCRDVQVPYTESLCTSDIQVTLKDYGFIDNPVLSNGAYECPNLQGLGISNYGNTKLVLELANKNNILISVPCDVIITKGDYRSDQIEKKVLESINVNVPAQGITTIEKNPYLPKCWTGAALDCKNKMSDLSECQPVTKYRIEQRCD